MLKPVMEELFNHIAFLQSGSYRTGRADRTLKKESVYGRNSTTGKFLKDNP